MNLQQTIRRILIEEFDKKINCKCGWSWKFSEGGDEPYLCHKCGNDNSKKESNTKKERLQKSIDEIGLSKVVKMAGIERVSKILGTTPLQLAQDFFLNKSFSINDFDVPTGGYDFSFEITDIEEKKEGLWYIYVKIGDGGVTLMTTGEYYDLWDEDLWDEDFWWEIQGEIMEIIYEILLPFEPKYTQIRLEHNLII